MINVCLSVPALIGIVKMKKWAFIPLAGLAVFGLTLSILYPPTHISGNVFNAISNLPLGLYVGLATLAVYCFLFRKKSLKA
ncbi:MAG: hypothetical protein WC505_02455 [Patescibacteria group bacterium]